MSMAYLIKEGELTLEKEWIITWKCNIKCEDEIYESQRTHPD
jgi:hypothetical protein